MGMRTIEIEYPEDVLEGGVDEEQVRALAREAFFVRLYERGLISSGRAAQALGMTRWDFLDLLGRYGVSLFDENVNFDEKLRSTQP